MSNWMKTKVETLKNVKQSYFEEALARMGFGIDWDNKEVHSAWRYNGDRTVDCVLTHLDSGRCADEPCLRNDRQCSDRLQCRKGLGYIQRRPVVLCAGTDFGRIYCGHKGEKISSDCHGMRHTDFLRLYVFSFR